METPAAFSATYADIKTIKTRQVVQIIFEVPVEAAGHAYNVLGGWPDFESERWFAIARLEKPRAE
jgi:hypothetical protein